MVKVTLDPTVLPLNFESVESLLHSWGVAGIAARDILGVESAQQERRIAKDMEAEGPYNRLKFEVSGVKFDVAHKRFGLGRRAWTKKNPMRAKLTSMMYQLLENKEHVPNYIIGAHWHKYLNH